MCWISSSQLTNYLLVEPHTGTLITTTYAVRVVETTLFSNWFFVGGDYSAYTLLRNTTNVNVPYTINWRNAAGVISWPGRHRSRSSASAPAT